VTEEERFWVKVDIRGEEECWPWTAYSHPTGYGRFWVCDKMVRTNRWVLEKKLGRPIREGYSALHSCDNPPCCNPKHVFEGTHSDNMQQAWDRCRAIGNIGGHKQCQSI
jgi:hypothetical protein